MGVTQLFEQRVLFSPNIPDAVDNLLQTAVAASSVDQIKAENLFLQAQALDKQCLQTYFALYKFYFFQKRLIDAEKIVLSALEESARQGSFPHDYHQLALDGKKWDLYASETTLFYLYSLKALAFIKLRQGHEVEAQLILSHLRQLDPKDLIGASVIMDLAAGVSE
ncbi:hypothetical protein [Methyloglobulus sp.]|uniref:hypothetical protein n=1 Tax=Methyloglobulus sp. TaxID=2518622 RepID=UPI0032B74F90